MDVQTTADGDRPGRVVADPKAQSLQPHAGPEPLGATASQRRTSTDNASVRAPTKAYRRALIGLKENGTLSVQETPSDAASPETCCFVIRDRMMRHYFHFMESILGCEAFRVANYPQCVPTQLFTSNPNWNNTDQKSVQQNFLAAAYPDLRVSVVREGDSFEADNVVLLDRGWAITTINKMLEGLMEPAKDSFDSLRARVYKAVGLAPSAALHPAKSILYVSRQPPRILHPELESQLLLSLKQHSDVLVCDFATMSWREQVAAVASVDAIVGVHGNGLTNLLWLRPQATVIELFPGESHQYDYQLFAEIAGHRYFGFVDGGVYREGSRCGSAYGPKGRQIGPVMRLDLPAIHAALAA